MGNALQEQLLKAGLVDKNKANRAKSQKHKKLKQQRNTKEGVVDEAKLMAEKAIKEKAERDKALNLKRNEEAQQKAVIAQIKQLIDTNRLPKGNGDDQVYNFEDQKSVKRIFVTKDIHDGLTRGKLAIVKFDTQYDVVPAPVSDKIKIRDEKYIILRNDPSKEDEQDDDFYADYQIPDDLMW